MHIQSLGLLLWRLLLLMMTMMMITMMVMRGAGVSESSKVRVNS